LSTAEARAVHPPLLEDASWLDFTFSNQYPDPNNSKLLDYQRLDITYQTTKEKKRSEKTLSLGIRNVYNRQNTYLIFYDQKDSKYKNMTLFPVMPFIMLKRTF
jgi:hypothetical protein